VTDFDDTWYEYHATRILTLITPQHQQYQNILRRITLAPHNVSVQSYNSVWKQICEKHTFLVNASLKNEKQQNASRTKCIFTLPLDCD